MIRFTRTAATAGGHIADVLGFAGKVTDMVNERFPDAGLRWGMQVGGPPGMVHWTMDVPDLATVESMFTALLMDGDYTALVDSSGAFFEPGSVQDTLVSML
jgi:hypothetical protein